MTSPTPARSSSTGPSSTNPISLLDDGSISPILSRRATPPSRVLAPETPHRPIRPNPYTTSSPDVITSTPEKSDDDILSNNRRNARANRATPAVLFGSPNITRASPSSSSDRPAINSLNHNRPLSSLLSSPSSRINSNSSPHSAHSTQRTSSTSSTSPSRLLNFDDQATDNQSKDEKKAWKDLKKINEQEQKRKTKKQKREEKKEKKNVKEEKNKKKQEKSFYKRELHDTDSADVERDAPSWFSKKKSTTLEQNPSSSSVLLSSIDLTSSPSPNAKRTTFNFNLPVRKSRFEKKT